MKSRIAFVEKSKKSSYLICFARISDFKKAKSIIKKHELEVLDIDGVNKRKNYFGTLGAEWCRAAICNVDEIMKMYTNGKYIVLEECLEANYDNDDPVYNYDFEMENVLLNITEKMVSQILK